jgi:hypothetical protein
VVLAAIDKLRENKDLNIQLRYHLEEAVRELKKPTEKK